MDIQTIILSILLLFFIFIIIMNLDIMKRGQSVDIYGIAYGDLYGNHIEGMKNANREYLDPSANIDIVTPLFSLQTEYKKANITTSQLEKMNTDLSGVILNLNRGLVTISYNNGKAIDTMNSLLVTMLNDGPTSTIPLNKTTNTITKAVESDIQKIIDYIGNIKPGTPTLDENGNVVLPTNNK